MSLKSLIAWHSFGPRFEPRWLDQYLEGMRRRQSPKNSGKPFKGTIISINAVNSIGVAKMHVQMNDFNYDKFLSFHNINSL